MIGMVLGSSLLCFYFYILCYVAVPIKISPISYAQYYAHVKDLCLGIWTVLLEYIHLHKFVW